MVSTRRKGRKGVYFLGLGCGREVEKTEPYVYGGVQKSCTRGAPSMERTKSKFGDLTTAKRRGKIKKDPSGQTSPKTRTDGKGTSTV